MAWNKGKARARIARFIDSVPQGDIRVEDFRSFVAEVKLSKGLTADTAAARAALVDIPRNRAITTHGVHVYANLINFNSVLTEIGRETEASHRRALEFLHAHYQACDLLIDEFEMQRIDFHGGRLHAVVLAPEGLENEGERVRVAVAFAAAFRELTRRLGQEFPRFQTGVCIGIDSGPAVAIDSGRKDEREPLFVGSPANHAAKLAAGDQEGVNLGRRAADALNRPMGLGQTKVFLTEEFSKGFLTDQVETARGFSTANQRLEKAYETASQTIADWDSANLNGASFKFHHKEPPLKDLVYADHPPSNAIRMELASIFADIDNFTAYIDNAIVTGRVAEAVANLHVIRAEMGAVLRDDFKGRKVRYIGDCIHGLIAEGTRAETDAKETIRAAVDAAAGIRSSFDLCKDLLQGVADLGLAIGIEYGPTPVCRLGLRGDGSVRAAASRATCSSEAVQQLCNGTETALGEAAFQAAPVSIRLVFSGAGHKVPNFDVDAAEMLLPEIGGAYISSGQQAEPLRAHQTQPAAPLRAHCKG
jgi:hypothetical protein